MTDALAIIIYLAGAAAFYRHERAELPPVASFAVALAWPIYLGLYLGDSIARGSD